VSSDCPQTSPNSDIVAEVNDTSELLQSKSDNAQPLARYTSIKLKERIVSMNKGFARALTQKLPDTWYNF
jgi:hypothetical protein